MLLTAQLDTTQAGRS